ncbi:MAG: GTPase Era [Thiobacillus sp. 63-78]|uniref:GTPase Era n=1 Tax=Thiobacillus sp. 63-78 TaxID=1895859 RepID=UPI00095D145B|nr:GTPase Era [Thiobacillus sp. 63-78]MBN8762237.1 GTPase Era [Thiobacillus sp.]MBN8774637.1 GTPase Era [Thiobacillus sp.]OJZ12845.1 MAG: GTPase Era [Thiobacillus sp. 63-78]
MNAFKCGLIAIVGRPNVGKSTLLNRIIGQKISITSRKAQTTRHRVMGIHTTDEAQFVFVDTPGFQTRHGSAMNRAMNKRVRETLSDTDVVMMLVEAGRLTREDRQVMALLPGDRPLILAVNKIDYARDRAALMAYLQEVAAAHAFTEIVPVSAKQGSNLGELLKTLQAHLPENPPLFDEDDVTDQTERQLAAELIREKVFRLCGEEIPYAVAVTIDKFEEEGNLRRIFATILVDRDGHKAIVIGKGGEKLKTISTQARLDMERAFDGKVYLEVWVKVKGGWADDVRMLKSLGID